jgi:hypothetical protein
MMNRILTGAFLTTLMLASAACGAINTLTGGSSNMTTVAELWSDVPRMDAMTASKMEMPLYAKVLMRTALNQITGEGKNSGDWIVFATTKTPGDVKNFYTNARMTAKGWEASDKSTCLSGSDQGIPQVGVFCVFIKHQTGKDIGLMIIAGQDDQTKQTNVLFIRVEGTVTPTPTPNQ